MLNFIEMMTIRLPVLHLLLVTKASLLWLPMQIRMLVLLGLFPILMPLRGKVVSWAILSINIYFQHSVALHHKPVLTNTSRVISDTKCLYGRKRPALLNRSIVNLFPKCLRNLYDRKRQPVSES